MEAVISGQAGLALLIDGERLASIHVDSLSEEIPRRPADLPYLFGDARDFAFLEDVQIDEVRRRLESARNSRVALDLALILLDPDHSERVRRLAAQELDEAFADSEIRIAIERVLFAHPLPPVAALETAKSCAPAELRPRASEFLSRLIELQPRIETVRNAWDSLPDTLFETTETRAEVHSYLVREGYFRRFVIEARDSEPVTERFDEALVEYRKSVDEHRPEAVAKNGRGEDSANSPRSAETTASGAAMCPQDVLAMIHRARPLDLSGIETRAAAREGFRQGSSE